jgi:hypothetical protein
MAKQAAAPGADASLVSGARALYRSTIPIASPGQEIEKTMMGFADMIGKIKEKKEQEIKDSQEREYKSGLFLDGIPEYNPETSYLNSKHKESVQGFLQTKADRVKELVGKHSNATGKEKAEIELEISKEKAAMNKVVAQVAALDVSSRDINEDIKEGNYSVAADPKIMGLQQSFVQGESPLLFDEDGTMYTTLGDGGEKTEGENNQTPTRYNINKLYAADSLPKKEGTLAANLMQEVANATQAGSRGTYDANAKAQRNIAIDNLAANLTPEQVLSLAGDNFTPNVGGPFAKLTIADLKEWQNSDPMAFREAVIDEYKTLADISGTEAQKEYDRQQSIVKTTTTSADEREAQMVKNNWGKAAVIKIGGYVFKKSGDNYEMFSEYRSTNGVVQHYPVQGEGSATNTFEDYNAALVAAGNSAGRVSQTTTPASQTTTPEVTIPGENGNGESGNN